MSLSAWVPEVGAKGDQGEHGEHKEHVEHSEHGDAGKAAHDAGPRETAGQRAERRKYVEETLAREREITRHRIWTPEMSRASWKHWRRAYRALRVRELAEDDKEDAVVARVDAYLKKATDHFFSLMTELASKAPEIPPAPTLLSPVAGAQATVGQPVSFKMAPYKEAAHYYCWFWEPGGHSWSNWQAKEEHYGDSPECDIPADDPRWGRFRSGKAEFYGRAIIPVKLDGGKELRMWSDPVKLEVDVVGGKSPAPAEGGAR
jgi:hypothetical protein